MPQELESRMSATLKVYWMWIVVVLATKNVKFGKDHRNSSYRDIALQYIIQESMANHKSPEIV